MRTLITGIAGFAGSHLADWLLAQPDVMVAGVVRPGSNLANVSAVLPRLHVYRGDVADHGFVERTLRDWQPQLVFHLAGQSAPSLAWELAEQMFKVNVLGQFNILKAVAEVSPAAAVLVVGSGDEYGVVAPSELPIGEDNPLRPTNPYAVSKIAQDMTGYQFYASHHLRVVRVRPFNHVGPRQGDAFVTAALASQIAAIEAGRREPVLKVGNLEAKRDFCDVRDMVRAYWLALREGVSGEVYNIGSGRSMSIAYLLDLLLRESTVDIEVKQEESRFRRSDVPEVVCDVSRFRRCTGWQPEIPIEQTMSDLLRYWRERMRGDQS